MILNSRREKLKITVVIPAFKVASYIQEVVQTLPDFIDHIIVVDDSCPENSGIVASKIKRKKNLLVLHHKNNLGVGGAMKTGYLKAMELNSDIIVKIDGDGQMDPNEIQNLIYPIAEGVTDYSKGNRFYSLENVRMMPTVRMLGNLALSFMSKISTGYYEIFDPNNGYTAISGNAIKNIELKKVDNRYFFESDMLFQLNLANYRVLDIPMLPIYRGEFSSLKISQSVFFFLKKHVRNALKRLLYTYFIRDFNVATLELIFGFGLLIWGLFTGSTSWIHGQITGIPTQTGTLVLVAILVVSGIQLLLSFLNYDMNRNRNRI